MGYAHKMKKAIQTRSDGRAKVKELRKQFHAALKVAFQKFFMLSISISCYVFLLSTFGSASNAILRFILLLIFWCIRVFLLLITLIFITYYLLTMIFITYYLFPRIYANILDLFKTTP